MHIPYDKIHPHGMWYPDLRLDRLHVLSHVLEVLRSRRDIPTYVIVLVQQIAHLFRHAADPGISLDDVYQERSKPSGTFDLVWIDKGSHVGLGRAEDFEDGGASR